MVVWKGADGIDINRRSLNFSDKLRIEQVVCAQPKKGNKFAEDSSAQSHKNLDRSLVATNNNKICWLNNRRQNRVRVGVYYDFMDVKVPLVANKEQKSPSCRVLRYWAQLHE